MNNLVIFSEDTIIYDGRDFQAGNPLPRMYGCLVKEIGKVILSSPVKTGPFSSRSEGWVEPEISYSARPYYGGSVIGFFRNLPRILLPTLQNIDVNVSQANLVMIRLPSPIGFLAWRKAKKLRKNVFLYVVGDIRKVAVQGEKYRGVIRWGVATAAYIFHQLTRRMARNALVFTTGSELYNEFRELARRCVNLIPSVVSEHDIVHRENACKTEPIRLLYVGRLVPVKGLRYLLEALPLTLARGINVELWIVGDGYQKPALEEMAGSLGLKDQVRFLGRVPFGPELFQIYRQADVFVLPSLSEGIPKTLLEAMASGTPIVATRVGGIPDVVKDRETGLLVEPRSPHRLAEAIERIVRDKALRERIIKNAYAFVREHTVEKQAERMWQEIRAFFSLEQP